MFNLLRQKRMTRLLYDFFKHTEYSSPSTYQSRIQDINNGGVKKDDFLSFYTRRLSLKDKILSFFCSDHSKGPQYQLDRKIKAKKLLASCLSEDFIRPTKDDIPLDELTDESYLEVSTREGMKLISFIGFFEILLERYPLTSKTLFKIGATIVTSSGVTYLIIKLINRWLGV